jgi:hypothetical protein
MKETLRWLKLESIPIYQTTKMRLQNKAGPAHGGDLRRKPELALKGRGYGIQHA